MNKTISIFLFCTLFILSVSGQTTELQNYIDQGVKLHDNGDYKGAIELYEKALKIDPASPLVNYEISSSYYAWKNYEKAIAYSDIVIGLKSNFVDEAYILKGSAQDMMDKPKDAIATYKEAIKEYPNNHLLYFNLALTSYNIKEYKEAEQAVQKALTIKPSHASSHLLLGYVMNDQGSRVKSLLALYNFLLLEPNSGRAKAACKLLETEMKQGVKKSGDKSISITFNPGRESDEFNAAELMLSLLESSKSLEKNKNKPDCELFADNTKSFFSVLGELKKNNNGFWWNYYVDFFYEMTTKKHVEAYSYYITQSKEDATINSWVTANKDKVDALLKWFADYERKQ